MSGRTLVWLLLSSGLLSLMADLTSLAVDPTHRAYYGALLDLDAVAVQQSPVGVSTVPVPTADIGWLRALWGIGTWDYHYLTETTVGMWIRVLVLWPLTGLLAWGMLTTVGPALAQLAQVAVTAATGLASGVGSIIGGLGSLRR